MDAPKEATPLETNGSSPERSEEQFIHSASAGAPALTPAHRVHTIFIGPSGLRMGWRLFLYLAMGVAIFLLLVGVARRFPHNGTGKLWAGMYVQILLAAAALAPAYVMARIERRPFGAYGLPRVGAFGRLFWVGMVWGIAALSCLMLAMRGVGAFSFGHLAIHGERILNFAAFYAVMFVLVGFFEEFTFRGYTQFTVAHGIGFWPAAALLSLIFGGLHLSNPGEAWVGALSAGLIGFFFCFTLRRTGSLWFAVGMHASWDWGESFLYSVPDSGGMSPGHLLNSSFHGARWLTGGSVGPEGSVLVFVVIAAMWVVFDRMYPQAKWTGA